MPFLLLPRLRLVPILVRTTRQYEAMDRKSSQTERQKAVGLSAKDPATPYGFAFYNELPKERAHELLVDSLQAPTLSIGLTPSPQTSNAFDPGTSATSSEIHNSLSASILPVLALAVMSIVVELLEWRRMRWNIKTKNIT